MRSYLRFIYFVFYLVSFWKCGASQTQSCGFNAVATTNPQIITSPGFPNNYAPGIECTWRLTTDVGMNILLTFVSFNTEKSRDFLFVDLPDRSFFSGSGVGSVVGKQLRSSNRETTLKFIADSINNRPGFNLTYRAIPAEVNCGRSAVATATPQIITSPGYPNNYPNNTICNWNISAPEGMKIRFNLKYLSTEQNFDFLKIYSKGDPLARFSGVVSNQIFISTDNELNVVFTSDNLIGGIGFNATFMEIPPCGFDAVATTTSQIITSPNYPKHYSNNEKCIWRINATTGMRVKLQIESFFTHGNYDYLSVKSGNVNLGRLSRSYPLKIFRSSSNNMTLTFVSDKFGTYPGFRATFVAIPEQINITHCGYDTTATTTNQVITSPGYPNSYPNDAICNWTISAPEGWRIKLQIKSRTELGFDYFQILASGISGIRRSGLYDHTFYSTDNLVNLLFISDASITSSGLNATYSSLAPCGFNAVATTARKTITSRNYPEPYIPLEDCIWKINTTAGMEIQLNFENFFIENGYEFLTITTGANQVTRLTGLHNNKAFRSTGNHMTLRFTSDGSVQKSGFNLTYFAIPGPKSTCENHYVATTTIQSISSPGYPNRYPDFLSCIWVISVPAGHRIQLFLESLDTEANFDVLSISSPDGTLARFSGSVSRRNFQSVGNFTMQFSTDNANAKTGFNVTFFAEPAATCFSGLHPVEGTPLLSKKCDLSETCATFHGSLEGANGTYHACFPKSNCLKFDCSTQHGLDYLRNISGYNVNSCEKFQCCHEDKCNKPPQSACLGNMISVDCGSGCSLPTCGQPTPLPGPCPQICRKCVCPVGQVLFENNTCIPFVQCPRKGPTCYSGIQTRTTTSLGFKQCGLNETCVTYQGMVKIEESAITDGTYFGCISKMSCSTFDCKLPAGVQYLRKTSGYNFTSCNNLQCCSGILCNKPETGPSCYTGEYGISSNTLGGALCGLTQECAMERIIDRNSNLTTRLKLYCADKSQCSSNCTGTEGCKSIECCKGNLCNNPLSVCLGNLISVKCGSGCPLPTCDVPIPEPSTCSPFCKKCVCPEGTVLNANDTCIPIGQCPSNGMISCSSNPCPPNSNCTDLLTSDGYECECDQGYQWDNLTETCIDINECFLGADNCLVTAICTNNVGSYECFCPEGLEGDGVLACAASDFCQDVDCVNGVCQVLATDYVCVCDPGFTHGDTGLCDEDILECQMSPRKCRNGGICVEEFGSFSCICSIEWEGPTCEDNVNECEHNPCQANSTCTDLVGGYTCTCNPGFILSTNENVEICLELILFPMDGYKTARRNEKISFGLPLPVLGGWTNLLYINDNGILFTPLRGSGYRWALNRPFLRRGYLIGMAPFWDNFDPRSGSVRYLIDEDFEGLDMSIPGLQRAKDLVMSKYGYNIEPRIFLRVEWNQKLMFPRNRFRDKPSTFQCIVVSDGIDGFILYVYQPGMMLFKKDPTIRRLNLGFSAFINFGTIATISSNYDMDKTSNVGINGIHIHRYSYGESRGTRCLRWLHRQPVPMWRAEDSPCPPNRRLAQRDDRFIFARNILRRYSLRLPTSLPCYTRETDSVNPPLCCYVWGRFSRFSSHYERFKLLFSGRSSQQAQENYKEEEIDGFDNCCSQSLSLGQRNYFCPWYRRRRPTATSRGYRTIDGSFGFGEPHFTTLNNEKYTFNGHGEYILVDQPGQFMMQGRAEPALNINGTETKATFFTAIAAKNLATGDTVRFHANAAGNDTVININGNITTLPVIDELETSSQLRYRRTSATKYEFVFSPNVTLIVFTIQGVVGFAVKLSDNLKQTSRGLLNPVEYRNGTAINITTLRIKNHSQLLDGTVDQEKIFPFGQSWHIKRNESLFEYTLSRNFSYYNRPQKVPDFLRSLVDGLDNAKMSSIINTCGIKALACVFDLALTGNEELAKSSKLIAEESEMLHRLAVNNAPEIYYDKNQGANFVNGTIRAVVGTNFTIQFKANDRDGNPLVFSVNNDQIPGVSIDSSGLLTFVVTSANNMAINNTLTISVNDSLTDDNEEINILVCNCNSRGSCQWTDTIRGGSENYGLVPCDCMEAYDGAECMDDADGCADDPCFTNCTDVPAPGLGYTCAPCPAHLTGNGTSCLDRDECEEGTDNCAQNCTNVVNSFNCSCHAGFMVDSSNSSNCVNVNECTMNPNICAAGGSAAVCLDTKGSYMCACKPGYKMDGAGVCVDIPDCNNRTICDNTTSVCQETPGSYRCDCKTGYSRRPGSSSNSSCVNTNECTGAKPVCSSGSRCVDSEGSFSCICLPGYIRQSKEVCTPNVTSCAKINCTAERSVCKENGRSPVTCVCRGSRVQRSNKCLPKYKFQQRMRDSFRSEYNDLNNALTRAYISRFKANMLLMLAGKNISEILVTKLMSGSVIVLYELILNEAQGSPVLSQQDLLVTISQAISSGQFNTSLFDGTPTTSSDVSSACPVRNITDVNIAGLNSESFKSTLTCSSELVGISIDVCNLTNAGLSPSDLVLAGPGDSLTNVNPMCRPRILSLPDGSLTATFLLFNILSCGYRSTMTGDSITLTYDVRNVKQVTASVIERYYEAVISFNCTFNRSAKIDSSSVLPKISKMDLSPQSAEGRFDISMNLFRDENCTMPFQGQGGNPPVIMVEDYIYFKAALSKQLPGIVLQAPTCWATPTSDAQSDPKYYIISGGCASAMDSSKIKVIKNYETYYISAGVASFIWTNITDQRIYIHCEVDVCSSTASNCTGPVCSSRKKRDTSKVMNGGKKIYSIGPITVAATCDQLEPGICSQKCDVVQGKPKCSCVDGYYLADDERTCIYNQNDAVSTSHSNLTTLIQLGMFLILIGCMCWLLAKKKRTKE